VRPYIDPRPFSPAVRRLLKVPRVLTASLRRLPDFIIIGGERCGTTSLYRCLLEHPSIVPAFRKELHFFDLNFGKGLKWYREHFPSVPYRYLREWVTGAPTLTGEATVYYLWHPHAARRAAATVPEAKLIALLRNPVDRAYSQYHHERLRGREGLRFEEAVDAEAGRLEGEVPRMLADEGYRSEAHRRHSYLARGVYVDQLRLWLERFPRQRLLVLRSEDFYADPGKTLGQTFEFLGLPPWPRREYRRYNQTTYPPMAPATRRRLLEYFRPHNQRLAEFLDRDFGWER
jgi:hypothetical protein